MAALAAIAQGLEERGEAPPPPLLAWAGDLAQTMLREEAAPAGGWEVAGGKKNSFAVQERRCANGLTVPVVSSLNHAIRDAERQTGVLRSPWFAAPARVSFWICGHQGHPKEPANHQNFVRLIDEAGQQQRQAFPPRNDVCQKVEWDLAELKGARVRIEIVDGDDGASYAWLGVTRFEPEASWVADFAKAMERHDALRVVAEVTRNTAPVELRERLAAYLPAASAPPPVAVDANQRRAMDALIQARLEAFAAREPNAEKGRDVFATNCAVCHQIQGEGALIGPQLDGIKARGVARLCEDILDPSRNVDAHFHLHLVRRQDGRTTAGFLRGEPGQVMELVDTQGETHRVPKREVVEDQVTAVSIMPAGFGQILSEQQFTDLLGWLMTQ